VLGGSPELLIAALGLLYLAGSIAAGLYLLRAASRPSGAGREPLRKRAGGGPARPGRRRPGRSPAWPASWLRTSWHPAVSPGLAGPRVSVLVDPADCVVYFIVVCRKHERSIEDSVRNLLADPRGIVVLVGDTSPGRTATLAAAIDPGRVIVVRRDLAGPRPGRGPALNAGFARVLQDAAARGLAPSQVTVSVMAPGSQLSAGALDAVLPLFADQLVGGVQLPIRIRRAGRSVLAVLQDLQTWAACALAQLGRTGPGAVSPGGSGQFSRLAALLELGQCPWRAQLSEDLNLALALAAAGWRLTSTPDAYVTQRPVTGLRALLSQRTRWYQGHLQAGRWLPALWGSRRPSRLSLTGLSLYLLAPWAVVLPWTAIISYNLAMLALWAAGRVAVPGPGLAQRMIIVAAWYAACCIPAWLAGLLYRRQRGSTGPVRALLLGHLLLLDGCLTGFACWHALGRLLAGATGWPEPEPQPARAHRRDAPASGREPALIGAGGGQFRHASGRSPGSHRAGRR
jgi:1,2-diacylglycerol 3-beta-glucosyltransferase